MALHLITAVRDELVDAVREHLVTATTAVVDFYASAMPADAEEVVPPDDWLGEIPGLTSWGPVDNGVMSITDTLTGTPTGTITGVAAWFQIRLPDDGDTILMRGTVGVADADLIVDTVDMGGGTDVTIVGFDIQIVA